MLRVGIALIGWLVAIVLLGIIAIIVDEDKKN